MSNDKKLFLAADYIHMACTAGHSVRIEVPNLAQGSGLIEIHHGTLWSAQLGELSGDEAFKQLVVHQGACRVGLDTSPPGTRNIRGSSADLMLEVSGVALAPIERAPVAIALRELTPEQLAFDVLLEAETLGLLLALERPLAALGQRKSRKRPQVAVKILEDLVNRLQDSIEEISVPGLVHTPLVTILAQIEFDETGSALITMNCDRLSVTPAVLVMKTLGKTKSGPVLEAVADSIVELVREILRHLSEQFCAEAMRDQWVESCAVFTEELIAAVHPAAR